MTDREQIMNDFEHEVNKAYGEGWDFVDLSTDDAKKILVLLKEQEAVKPVETWNTYLCGNCNRNVYHEERQGCLVLYEERYTYCPNCGRKVKWDDSDRNGNG